MLEILDNDDRINYFIYNDEIAKEYGYGMARRILRDNWQTFAFLFYHVPNTSIIVSHFKMFPSGTTLANAIDNLSNDIKSGIGIVVESEEIKQTVLNFLATNF